MAVLGSIPVGLRRPAWALGAALVVLVAAGLVQDRLRPRRFAEVEPGWLYRSGRLRPLQMLYAREVSGIDTIIDLTPHNDGRDAEAAAARASGIDWVNFPLKGDGTGSIENYVGAVAAIAAASHAGKHVLVHCHLGKARTGGVLVAYLALVEGAPMEVVIRELARFSGGPARDIPVLTFLEDHLSEIAGGLAARGIPLAGDPQRRMALLRDLVGTRGVVARNSSGPRG